MKDPIPLTNEQILENISEATLNSIRRYGIPKNSIEEFEKFPLPARFIIMGKLFRALSSKQQEENATSESKENLDNSDTSMLISKLLIGEKSIPLLARYYDYWMKKGKEWWDSIVFKEDLH